MTRDHNSYALQNLINVTSVVGSSTQWKSSLKIHQASHSEDRPYVCKHDGCGASFKTKGSLTRHDLRHTDQRPFSCQKCGRSFRESGALRRHERAVRPCSSKQFVEHSMYGKTQPLTQENTTPNYININFLEQQDLTVIQDLHNQVGGRFKPSEVNKLKNVVDLTRVVSDDEIIVDSEQMNTGDDNSTHAYLPNKNLTTRSETAHSQCIVCSLKFDKKTELQSHLLTHVNQPSYPCNKCDYVAESRKDLTSHTTRLHLLDPKLFVSITSVSNNHTTDHNTLHDSLTQLTALNEESTNQMRDSHRFTNQTIESEINECQSDSGALTTQQHGEDRMTGVISSNAASEGTELNNLNDDQVFVRDDIKQAVRSACKAIQQLILLESDIPIHIRKNKNCPVCQKSFKANSYLQNHIRIHTGERPFKCKDCFKDFSTMDTFRKHMLSHSSNRQYKCGECGKLFKRISHVKEHLKIHSNERPYSCELCEKSFRNRNTFKVHMRTHTAVLPWLCKICSKRFREKASLIRHVRIHTGERPFTCKYCGKTFAEQSTVNRHLNAKVPCRIELALSRSHKNMSYNEDVVQELTVPTVPSIHENTVPTVPSLHETTIPTVPGIHETIIPTVNDDTQLQSDIRISGSNVLETANQNGGMTGTCLERSQTGVIEDNSCDQRDQNVIYVNENLDQQITQSNSQTIFEENCESSSLVLYESDVILLNST